MTRTYEIGHGAYRWTLAAGLAGGDLSCLLDPAGLPLDRWRQSGQATVVKETPHRTVYHVALPGLDLHVKHYRGQRRDGVRRLFRASRGRREFTLGNEVARRGVPTLELLACADVAAWRGRFDSFVVTRTLPGAVSLLDFLESSLPALAEPGGGLLRRRLAVAIGRLLARQHQAGVTHDDLHPGNILLRPGDAEPELYLIDLDMVRLGRPLDWSAARANLVVLDRWFAARWTRTDRRRAWRAYCAARPELGLDERTAAREVEAATRASLLTQLRGFDRRCLGGNRHYRAVRRGAVVGHCVNDLDPADLAALLADPEALFRRPDVRLLKQSPSSTVVECVLRVSGVERPVIGKRVPARSWKAVLAALFRPPPALTAYVLGHGLRLRGLPTPRPLAVLHRHRLGLPLVGYLLVEKVPQPQHLLGFLESLHGMPTAERRRRLGGMLDQLAGLLRRLHRHRLSHRDLKAANLLVSPAGWVMGQRGVREQPADPSTAGDHLWFVDLHGVRRQGPVGKKRRMRDLARLHLSFLAHADLTRADRLRFLVGYLDRGEVVRGGWKGWWRAVEHEARAKAAKLERLNRVIG